MKLAFGLTLSALFTIVFASCGGDSQIPKTVSDTEPTLQVERIYKGTLNCLGCEGVFSELTVRHRSNVYTYLLNEAYNHGDQGLQTVRDSGTFQVLINEPEFGTDTVYLMKGRNAADRYYRQRSPDTLELVYKGGKPVDEDVAQYLVIRK